MGKVEKLERKKGLVFPEIYKEFFRNCQSETPTHLVGTDLADKYPNLNEWAIELLEEDGANFALEPDDFVFLMHQGYVFCYFKADGNADPQVYRYTEGKLERESAGKLSDFLAAFSDPK